MKRILFLSQLLPYPLNSGAKTRAYFVLRYLAQRNHVTLLAFTRPDDLPEAKTHLKEFCAEVHTIPMLRSRKRDLRALLESLSSNQSFVIRRDYVPEMAKKIQELLSSGEYEAVHTDQLWMAQYALLAQKMPGEIRKPILILDEHNACFQIFQRLAEGEGNPLKRLFLEREWRSLKRFEVRACANFDRLVTVTDEDRATLQGLIEGQGKGIRLPQFSSIPICVETDSVPAIKPVKSPPNILHMGTMFWLPNIEGMLWFAREVWPQVEESLPSATLTIIGKNPPLSIQELANGQPGKDPDQNSKIEIPGYVADPQLYLERAGVFIVPLLSGGGMRVKIVDGWRWGLPIVSTTVGAEGIHYRDRENILIADSPQDFAEAVIEVLKDPNLSDRLREKGRGWVEETYNWRAVYPAWDAVYGESTG